jgi:hypothetical protein
MDTTTKAYYNNSSADLNVIGIGDIPAGETVSITSQYPPAVVLENYPGLVDVTNYQQSDWDALAAASTPAPSAPSTDTQTGGTSNG